jgi:hypothetical protein
MIYTQRIFWPSYDTETKLSHLLDFLQEHRALCDEICFFTEGDGMDWRYLPRDEIERRAEFLTRAVGVARGAGFATAINVLNTMGHSDEGGESAPDVPWQGIVGHDGTISRKCSCPFDADFLEYIAFKYQSFARCAAGKYWIDDDVRLNNHAPVGWGCFCEKCVADFSARTQHEYSRAGLVEALHCKTEVRAQWIARNNAVMTRVLAACADGVQRAEPNAEIGFMCCDVTDLHDCGADFSQWFGELSSRVKGRAWLRPGGGFWNDANPRAVLSKIHAVGNSIDALPRGVLSTYEVENYPFVQGEKSAAQTGLEVLLVTLATKLDGIMFDVLDAAGNDLAPFSRWTTDLSVWRPLWDRAAELVQNTTPLGWKPAYSPRHFEQHRGDDWNAMRHISYQEPLALQTAGLPLTAFKESARGHLLCGAAARGLSTRELKALLQKPLLLDGEAAQVFLDTGLGEEIGVAKIAEYSEGVYEEFSDHELNGKFAGYKRSATLRYFGARSHALSTLPGAQSLSTLRETGGRELGAALSLYENFDAAPVAVIGHLPWSFATSPQRMEQLQNLSQRMIGLRPLKSNRPVVAWWRAGDDKTLGLFFNAGFDEARDLVVPMDGVLALSTSGVSFDAAQSNLTLPAWSVAIIEWKANFDEPR